MQACFRLCCSCALSTRPYQVLGLYHPASARSTSGIWKVFTKSSTPQGKVGLPAMQMRNPMRTCYAYPVALHPSCLFRRPDNSPTSSPHHHCAGAQLLRCRFPATPDNIRRLSLQLYLHLCIQPPVKPTMLQMASTRHPDGCFAHA